MMINRGSEWRKWNFHIHTKGTNKSDQFKSKSMDEFLCLLFKKAYEQHISAVGITDYFTIERYLETIAYREMIDLKMNVDNGEKLFSNEEIDFIKSIFLFPNVELRMLPSTGDARLINIHCLFNPEYVVDLDNSFFSTLENEGRYKMNTAGITSYGKYLDNTLTDSKAQFKKGVDSFLIDPKSLKELIDSDKKFRENTLLVVSNSNKDGASGLQTHYSLFENEPGNLTGVRRTIYTMSNAVFSNNEKDRKYFLGRKSEGTSGYDDKIYKDELSEVIKSTGSVKPCITGCDSHSEVGLFNKFTWVKADLTFEGLKQICFEPEQRVKIQEQKPDYKEDKLVIEEVKFISPNKVFSELPLKLNENLNVIIGGKSSGKSILLYCIAETLLKDKATLKNDDDTYKYDLAKLESDFDFEIITKGGISQRRSKSQVENSVIPQIKYIPQNYLVKLAEPELNQKGKSLYKLVRDLIIEDEDSKASYDRFIANVTNNDTRRDNLIEKYFQLCENIQRLENDFKTKSTKEVLEKNIDTNSNKVEELNKLLGLSAADYAKFNTVQTEIEQNKSEIQSLISDFYLLKDFHTNASQSMNDILKRKSVILATLKTENIKEHFQKLYSIIDSAVAEIQLIDSVFTQTKDINNESAVLSDNIFSVSKNMLISKKAQLEVDIKPFLDNNANRTQLEIVQKSILEDKKALQEIQVLTQQIAERKIELNNCKTEITKLYKDSYDEYLAVLENLKTRTQYLQQDGLEIKGKVQFNFPKFRRELFAITDLRKLDQSKYLIINEKKRITDGVNFLEIFGDVFKLFDDVLSKNYPLNTKTTIKNSIKTILYDHFLDYWEIKYKNDKLGEMSTGKASFVILMLIVGLSKSKAPILIDQPEDNLDNRSITTDLVNYLKNKKIERQIILVTHNANVVVNADSENVIVANQKGQNEFPSSSIYRFDYINGALENSQELNTNETDILKAMGIRQHVADIVEGGKEAFVKREKRYGF